MARGSSQAQRLAPGAWVTYCNAGINKKATVTYVTLAFGFGQERRRNNCCTASSVI